MDALLKVQNLKVTYGAIVALKDVQIEVIENSITCILGANGGGKSTLLKTISGIVPSQEGSIIYDGEDITKLSPEKIAKKGIIHIPEGRQIFGELTVYENLMIGAFTVKSSVNGMSRKEQIEDSLERIFGYFPVLLERKNQIALSLSGGEQQMLAIARGLMSKPKLLILDEPSLGLAPLIVKTIFSIINSLKEEGITILIVEQNALQTLKIADYAYVLRVGNIVKQGKASELLNDSELIEAYLGK